VRKPHQFASVVEAQRAALLLSVICRALAPALLFLFGFMLAAAPAVVCHCKCRPADEGDATREGANQVVIMVEKETHRKLEGRVKAEFGGAVENALVEIFDNPDYLLDEHSRNNHPTQRRLAVCRTAADGKFCFKGLPSGKYELRSSVDGGWNITHVYVVVENKLGTDKAMLVKMILGT